jgi:phosphoglucosamine mutase
VRVAEKKDILTIPELATMVRGVEKKLDEEGRVLIRYSGTEPLLRIMLEGTDKDLITVWANEIANLVSTKIGGK